MMSWFQQIAQQIDVLFASFYAMVALRMLLTLILCGLVGLERSGHERASGFRPHIIVGLGACLATMAGAYGFPDIAGERDPLRVASYVISGIGFLGAGAIIRHGATVRGLTTAGTLWGAAGIGVTVATGLGWLAVIAVGLYLFTLVPLERLESRLRARRTVNSLVIHLRDDNRSVGKTLQALNMLGAVVKRATVLPAQGETAMLQIELVRALPADQMPLLARQLLMLKKHVLQVNTSLAAADAAEPADELSADDGQPVVISPVVPLNLSDDTLLEKLNESDAASEGAIEPTNQAGPGAARP